MRESTFSKIEEKVGKEIRCEWKKESAEVHRVERALSNKTYKGKKALRVIVDGGWSKRSLGHSYNANAGKYFFVCIYSILIKKISLLWPARLQFTCTIHSHTNKVIGLALIPVSY